MTDFTNEYIQFNNANAGTPGTDAAGNWSANMAFGGSAGANELRWAAAGAGATNTTASASWPYSTRPTSGTAFVGQMYGFPVDATGGLVNYGGGGAGGNYLVVRTVFSNDGTFASAPRFSAFSDNTHITPVPNNQVASPGNGQNIINGNLTDTNNNSYLKATAFGFGFNNGTSPASQVPAANAGAVTVTTGTAGSQATANNAWCSWQSLQGWTQYITNGVTPVIAGTNSINPWFWYLNFALFFGVNMAPGSMPFAPFTFDYTYS